MDNSLIPKINIPDIEIDTPMQHMWADEQFEIIKQYVEEFEETLDNEHEVGMMLTNFGQSVLMQVISITYRNPVLLIFKGCVNGRESTLIQHINQLSFLLTTVEKEPERPKRKIGFITD
jgi:hypothetical protein